MLAAVDQQGLKGIIANRLTSTYQAGRRSKLWIKTLLRGGSEVIVVGWSPSSGNQHVLGSLLLAVRDEQEELVYADEVGVGLTDDARRALLGRLRGLE